jgi:peptidoglycan-associated lipoprotein
MERVFRVLIGQPATVAALTLTALGAIARPTQGLQRSWEGLPAVSRAEPPSMGWRSVAADTEEHEAQKLYNIVRERLEKGELRSAQHLLEQLIARFPDTRTAERARRDLFALYRAEGAQRPLAVPLGEPSHLGAEPSLPTDIDRSLAAPPGSPSRQETLQGWQPIVRHARTLQEHFRSVAGDRVFFGEGSAEIGARAHSVLAAQAAWLKRYRHTAVVVEGYADEPGSAAENSDLSASRAEAVRKALVEAGVESDRIATKAYGSDRPVAICGEPQCAVHNRRAVSVVKSARKGASQPTGTHMIEGRNAMPMTGMPR